MMDLRIQPMRVRAPLVEMVASNILESAASPSAHCLVCGKKGKSGIALRCTECKAILFCSRGCREAHAAQTLATLEEPYRSYCTSRDGQLATTEFLFPCSWDAPCRIAPHTEARVTRRRLAEHGVATQALFERSSSPWRPAKCASKDSEEAEVHPSCGSLAGVKSAEPDSTAADTLRINSGCPPCVLLPNQVARPLPESPADLETAAAASARAPFVELNAWDDYCALRGLPPGGPVAEALCLPLTLFRIASRLCKSTRGKLSRGEKIVVHYLGPEEEPLWLRAFQEVGCLIRIMDQSEACLPPCSTGLSSSEAAEFKASIERRRDSALYAASTVSDSGDSCTSMASAIARAEKKHASSALPGAAAKRERYEPEVDIWMVGPCVTESMNGWRNKLGSGVQATMLRGRYDEWLDSGLLPQADLVVALNCGLAIYANWEPTLRKLKESSTPAFFTDYSVACCTDDAEVLTRLGFTLSYPITPNPFQLPFLRKLANNADRHPCSNKCIFGINS